MASRTSQISRVHMTSLALTGSKMGTLTHLFSRSMTRMRSSSWTASDPHHPQFHHLRTAPVVTQQTMPPTRMHDHDLTSQRLYGYSFFCCITNLEPPHTSRTFFFRLFLRTPTHFLPGRVTFRTLGLLLYIACIWFCFFFVMREVYPSVSTLTQPSSLVFNVQYALLTTCCTHLIPRATFYTLSRARLGYPGTTYTYDACIP